LKDPADDLHLQDMLGGILKIEADGPDDLRLRDVQKNQLKALWPQILKQLESNQWKPMPLDDKIRAILTSEQKSAILQMTHNGQILYPPQLQGYIEPLKALLSP
jgi:hypothetical protein